MVKTFLEMLAGTPANAKAFPKTFWLPEYSNKDMVWT